MARHQNLASFFTFFVQGLIDCQLDNVRKGCIEIVRSDYPEARTCNLQLDERLENYDILRRIFTFDDGHLDAKEDKDVHLELCLVDWQALSLRVQPFHDLCRGANDLLRRLMD